MTVKIIFSDDFCITKVNNDCSIEEIAGFFFQNQEVKEVVFLDCESEKTKFYTKTPVMLYRADKEKVNKGILDCKVRYIYKVKHHDTGEENIISYGLV